MAAAEEEQEMRKLHGLLVFAVIVGLAPQSVRADGNESIPYHRSRAHM